MSLILFAKKKFLRLFYEVFMTPKAAPVGSSRTAEPGPGTISIVDTNGIDSFNANSLEVNGIAAANDGLVSSSTYTRVTGLAFFLRIFNRVYIPPNALVFGWDNGGLAANSAQYGMNYESDYTRVTIRAGGTGVYVYALGNDLVHDFGFACLSTGGIQLARNGSTGNFKVLWVNNFGTFNPLFKILLAVATTYQFRTTYLQVLKLGGRFATDTGLCLVVKATTAAGDTFTAAANALVFFTITAATGVIQEIMFRWVDDNNTWIIRMDQAAGKVLLIEKIGGVETDRSGTLGGITQTQTNGTAYRIGVRYEGPLINLVVANVNKINYALAASNLAATGIKVNSIGANLQCYPAEVTL